MKKLSALFYALACIGIISCMHNNGNISISYNDSDQFYAMNAHFTKSKTRDVEEYMNSSIGRSNNISFANMRGDATITLDDHTTFYLKKSPGFLKIKLDKDENSYEAYHRIKAMCEGFKKLLTK